MILLTIRLLYFEHIKLTVKQNLLKLIYGYNILKIYVNMYTYFLKNTYRI